MKHQQLITSLKGAATAITMMIIMMLILPPIFWAISITPFDNLISWCAHFYSNYVEYWRG